jgi:hypothetical protein
LTAKTRRRPIGRACHRENRRIFAKAIRGDVAVDSRRNRRRKQIRHARTIIDAAVRWMTAREDFIYIHPRSSTRDAWLFCHDEATMWRENPRLFAASSGTGRLHWGAPAPIVRSPVAAIRPSGSPPELPALPA